MRADRQTDRDRQTDAFITILLSPTGDGVLSSMFDGGDKGKWSVPVHRLGSTNAVDV